MAEGPPMYRPEEYIFHLRKWFADSGIQTTDNRERDKKPGNGEEHQHQSVNIVLTELLDVSELLRNLKFDLKLAHVGFVAEFSREPNNGVYLLLDFLKTTQLGGQSEKKEENNNQTGTIRNGGPQSKKTLADEYECLLSLKHATRYQETMKRIMEHPSGVFLMASCALSNFMKSRIVALELLIKACEFGTDGHSQVEKAMSTLRLRYGEPVRFKFLVGMLSSLGNKSLTFQAYCLCFLNRLLETTNNICKRVYLQCEIEEAGLDTRLLQKFTEYREFADHKAYLEAFRAWKRNYVDVESLVTVSKRLTSDNKQLRGEVEKLKEVTKKLEEDKVSLSTVEKDLLVQCAELEQKVTTLSKSIENSQASDRATESKKSSSTDDTHEDMASPKTSSDSDECASPLPLAPGQGGLKGSDAMSISSEESPKSGASKESGKNSADDPYRDREQDIIVPHIQTRRPHQYVWPANRNNDSMRVRNTTNRGGGGGAVDAAEEVVFHRDLERGIRIRLCRSNDNGGQGQFENVRTGRAGTGSGASGAPPGYYADDFALNWSYPAVPLPIAVVTSGKSSLQDMTTTNSCNERYQQRSPKNSEGHLSDRHSMPALDFHKALFQRSYPVPSTERITRTFHV